MDIYIQILYGCGGVSYFITRQIRYLTPYIFNFHSEMTVRNRGLLLVSILGTSNAFVPNANVGVKLTTPRSALMRQQKMIQPTTKVFSTSVPAEEKQQGKYVDVIIEPQGKFLGDPVPYSALTIGVMKETYPGECRVSQSPDSVKTLVGAGFDVVVQAGGKFSLTKILRCSSK